MKPKFCRSLFIAIIAIVLTFSFTACNSDNKALLDRISKLEQESLDNATALETQNAKIAALETANTLYKTKIEALLDKISKLEQESLDNATALETQNAKIAVLETANALYKTKIEALTATGTELEKSILDLQTELDTLTASVVNATKIERVVIKPEDVGKDKPIAKSVLIDVALPNSTEKPQNIKIGCILGHNDYSFNFQLITFKVTLLINGKHHQDFDISVTQAKSDEYLVSQTFNTKILYDNSPTDVYTATWSEIVLYRFI